VPDCLNLKQHNFSEYTWLPSTCAYKLLAEGEKPEGISTHPDGERVYVANWYDGTVTVIDAKTLTVVTTIKTGDGSRAFGQFITEIK
jgi:YVTN family beta-propeller protein